MPQRDKRWSGLVQLLPRVARRMISSRCVVFLSLIFVMKCDCELHVQPREGMSEQFSPRLWHGKFVASITGSHNFGTADNKKSVHVTGKHSFPEEIISHEVTIFFGGHWRDQLGP